MWVTQYRTLVTLFAVFFSNEDTLSPQGRRTLQIQGLHGLHHVQVLHDSRGLENSRCTVHRQYWVL